MQVPDCAPRYEPTELILFAKIFAAYITAVMLILIYLAKTASTTHKEPL